VIIIGVLSPAILFFSIPIVLAVIIMRSITNAVGRRG
jgi:hypothetical protein